MEILKLNKTRHIKKGIFYAFPADAILERVLFLGRSLIRSGCKCNKETVTSVCVGVDIMKRYLGAKCLTAGEERASLSTHSSYVLTAPLNVGAGSTYGFCVTCNIWLGTA